jgi:hypothetical protein
MHEDHRIVGGLERLQEVAFTLVLGAVVVANLPA